MDFTVWGIIKEMVYRTHPRNIDHLRTLIENAFEELADNIKLVHEICLYVVDRCTVCYKADGEHFEHFKT